MADVSIKIDGKKFTSFERISIEHSFDAFSTVEFETPFDSDSEVFRQTFQPATFKPLEIAIDDSPELTGFMIVTPPEMVPERSSIVIDGYSSPGVLNDCTQAASALPFEYKNQNLQQVITTIVDSFELEVDFQSDPIAPFDVVKLDPTGIVLQQLIALAKQRSITLSNDALGKLVCWTENPDPVPVAVLEQGLMPLLQVTPVSQPQQYYSDITGLKKVKIRSKKSVQFTVKNGRLEGVVRPYIFSVPDVKDSDINAAVEAKVGRMFADMISYRLKVATWRTGNETNIWRPNTLVKVLAPDAMIYNPYTFFIRGVTLLQDSKSETAFLDVVLPGSFSGKVPEVLPWDL